MSSLLKLRRGSTVSHSTFTGADGEVTFNTDTNQLVSHDGATAGGFPHTKAVDLAASSGASLVGYLPTGTGAVATTVQAKLRESVSVLDFGADPTATIDSTDAFQKAITSGAWNGTTVYVPNGTYRIDGTLNIGEYQGNNYHYVTLIGESVGGSVLTRLVGGSSGPMMTINGFHNIIENLTFIGAVSSGAYTASHGLYIRGNPQANTNGLGTKYCRFSNLVFQRVGIAIQIGNYDVDGFDPDIETNSFHAIIITECNGGVFINGQNVLHNPFYYCHIVNCRDFLVKQTRGSDLWFERSYFGGMFDYLTDNYNVPATAKITATAGVVGLIGCRSEDWNSSTGNATPRFALHTNGSAMPVIYLAGNVFTTRDNATTEPSVSLNGVGSAGSVTTKATLIDNYFGGYVYINTIDVFSVGNTYLGTGAGVTNGRTLSANQSTSVFRDVFMDSNQEMEFPGGKFKRNSSVPVVFERPAVAVSSEWAGAQYKDEAGLSWGQIGKRVTNATAASESSVLNFATRFNGAYKVVGVGFGTAAPSTGTWTAGDRIINSAPAVGASRGWVCTATGTPGTWVAEESTASVYDLRGTSSGSLTIGRIGNVGAGSQIGPIYSKGGNSVGTDLLWSSCYTVVDVATAGLEDSSYVISTQKAGVFTEKVKVMANGNVALAVNGAGITVKSPDGLTTKTITINNAGVLTLI